MSKKSASKLERKLRREAARPIYERMRADGRRAPHLKPYLRTIETRLFDPDFNVTALTTHYQGVTRTLEGDLDRGYDDLARAHDFYTAAGVLSSRFESQRRRLEVQVPCRSDHALMSALCPDCRRALVLDVGKSLRRHLRRALERLPLDLEWFGVCCDECYRVVWKAFALARHALLDDAWQAWWLASHADLEDSAAPASVGRVIAALARTSLCGSGRS